MQNLDKTKRAAWRIARAALESNSWALASRPVQAAADAVDIANIVAASLDALGCFADKYGAGGSFETELAIGLVRSFVASERQAVEPLAWYGAKVFELVRDMDGAGLLTDADRKRCRVFDYDREQAALAKKQAEAEKREAARRAAEERAERAKRKQEALARLAEIEATKEAK